MNKTTGKKIGAALGILLGIIYIVNPTAGIIEFLPDALPIVGNLDEAGATALVLWGIQQLRGAPATSAGQQTTQLNAPPANPAPVPPKDPAIRP